MRSGLKSSLISVLGISVLLTSVVTGCGTTNIGSGKTNSSTGSPTSVSSDVRRGNTIIKGGSQYQGQSNLKKFVDAAKQNPNSEAAQISAGAASYVNGDFDQAIRFYKKASALNPKDGEPLNNIGNVYLRGKQDAKSAIPWYKKATQVDPSYAYGWWNLSIAESSAGNSAAAKQAIAAGLKDVRKSDPLYSSLQKMQQELAQKN